MHVVKRGIVNIFSSIFFNIRVECAKQPSHGDGSFVCPQLNFGLKIQLLFWFLKKTNKKNRLNETVFLSTHDICFG